MSIHPMIVLAGAVVAFIIILAVAAFWDEFSEDVTEILRMIILIGGGLLIVAAILNC